MFHGVIHSTVVREFSTVPESSPESRPESDVHARFRGDLGESAWMTPPRPRPRCRRSRWPRRRTPRRPSHRRTRSPVFVPPSVTDPVSNLDFLPVDDAFALEMRSETIEQLVGGDALRRGESERIEAGRSQANADLVAGRDRVRVQATLHEHTGHGLAEQAAHLHTTVDGTLDVHAASEDTVLLAGHMRDLWDGGAAIVAAMTDDTVGGGGIRVTTPLDLWVHGLMGVEERIGTCTADAVLLELGATHYEREYGPGAHAAGLAVYTGSLYQSNRSTFRPLMRVSSGVRNLIAGGDGGGGGGDAGAGGAPAVISAAGAGRRRGRGNASRLRDTRRAAHRRRRHRAGGCHGRGCVRRPHRHPPGRRGLAALAGGATRCRNLRRPDRASSHPLHGTAGQLAALRDAMRGGEAGTQMVRRRASRGLPARRHRLGARGQRSGHRGGHPFRGDSPRNGSARIACHRFAATAAARGEARTPRRRRPSAPVGGAGARLSHGLRQNTRASQNATDTHFRRLHGNRPASSRRPLNASAGMISCADSSSFGGTAEVLAKRSPDTTVADFAYLVLQKAARPGPRAMAISSGEPMRSARPWLASTSTGRRELQVLCKKHGIAEGPSTLAMRWPPATIRPTATVASIPPAAHPAHQFDWIAAYRQLRDLDRRFLAIGWEIAHLEFENVAARYVTGCHAKVQDTRRRPRKSASASHRRRPGGTGGTGVPRHRGPVPPSRATA